MKLLELKLINFKGIKEFTLSSRNGQNTNIYGENATGKTTLLDAFLWLLFDKNSKGQKNFEIKTLDKQGQPIPNLDHEVSAKIELENHSVELRKVYYERWTKKRGSAEKILTDHSTDYFVDGVPFKEKEYKEYIANIIDENVFKMLVDPFHFPETMKWEKRREILFEICGNVSEEDVYKSNPDLLDLKTSLNGHKIEDYRKILIGRKKSINDELEAIPIRIDEATRAMSDCMTGKELETISQIAELKGYICSKKDDKREIENRGGIEQKKAGIKEIESKLSVIKFDYETDILNKIREIDKSLNRFDNLWTDTEHKISSKQKIIDDNEDEITRIESEIITLRKAWHKENEKKFDCIVSNICPSCEQELPQGKIKEVYDKALASFNKDISEALEAISDIGKRKREKIKSLENENKRIKEEIIKLKEEKEKYNKEAISIEKEISKLNEIKEDYNKLPEYIELSSKKKTLLKEIEKLQAGDNKDLLEQIDKEIAIAQEKLDCSEKELAKINQNKTLLNRIDELKSQQKALASGYQNLEKDLSLIDQFILIKIGMVEGNINSKFKAARFKMFKNLLKPPYGGTKECCEVMDINGIPYSTALNRGACINIGLDIINTLADHYGFAPPIFIDNAEAITDILPTKGQQIRLYVQANQKSLRILTE